MVDKKQTKQPTSKRQVMKAQRQKKQRQQRLMIILVATGAFMIVVALSLIPVFSKPAPIKPITSQNYPLQDSSALGDVSAPVKVEVFEDFQCPACRNYTQNVEPIIVANYVASGKIRYDFRQYPFLDSNVRTKESHQAANASECAAEQGRFWDYHDILYANWNQENQGAFADKRLVAMAESLKLDMQKFKACFNANTFKQHIADDTAVGKQYGVTSTPSFVINGQLLTLDPQVDFYTQLSAAIDAAAAGK
jgi:protein-disulfide isomerase